MNAEAIEVAQQTELEQVTKAVAEFDRVSAGLAALRSKYHGVVYDVTTAQGMKDAREARAAIRAPRYEIERIRKEAKAPILALGKRLDTEAKRITEQLLALENPIDAQVAAEEARKEAEKEAKIQAELARVAALQERLAELRGCPNLSPTSGAALLAEHISDLEGIPVDETFEEFQPQAEEAKAAGLARLRALHDAAVAHEAEQARIKAEREELARLRAAEEERQAAERARLAEEERVAKAAREAEAAKERERLAAERAEQERVSTLRERLTDLREQGSIPADWTAAQIEKQIEAVLCVSVGEARWQEFTTEALAARQKALDSLQTLHSWAVEREQQAELLRQDREKIAAEERRLAEERAALERQQREAREAEERRQAAERAEAERLEREKAAEFARQERQAHIAVRIAELTAADIVDYLGAGLVDEFGVVDEHIIAARLAAIPTEDWVALTVRVES